MSEPITHTTIHTFNVEHYANPFLVCNECERSVTGYIIVTDEYASDHIENWANYPCLHIGITSQCPSWSPVDGCRCQEHLGSVEHSAPMIKKNIFEKEGP